ncbi:MAG: hypothetical protein U0Q18_32085 [Bryobacteraceae bacterium]
MPQVSGNHSAGEESANILSIPDMPVPALGVFQVPGGNQVAASGSGNSGPGQPGSGPGNGGGGSGQGSGTGSGHGGTNMGGTPFGQGGAGGDTASAGGRGGSPGHGFGLGSANGGGGNPGAAAGIRVNRVILPPDGRFTVLVQSSGSEAFPESEGVLTGKVVYTAYVKTGSKKEWLLQYCLPRAAETKAGVSGKIPPVDPPFPFLMLRPDISFGDDIDYLIVHGFVTSSGKFDQLKYVIAPAGRAEKDLLLSSLDGWQLRPGKLDGQPVSLEILLIIPRDGD